MSTPTTPNTENYPAGNGLIDGVIQALGVKVVKSHSVHPNAATVITNRELDCLIEFIETKITQAERRAELEGGLKELRGLPGKAPFVKADGMIATVNDRRTELLAELRTLQENQANE